MKKIALVTCRVLPEPDTDQELLVAALGNAGFEVTMLAWDNPAADPADHDLCVLRSTWDYYKHAGSFLKWIERADKTSRLMNPGFVVRWNYHKRYLGELASAGVPVVPTALFERGEEAVLKSIMEHRKWDDVVVKPSVSASSFRTKRFTGIAGAVAGQDFLRGLLKDRDAMVQQYMPSVEGDEGERAIVYVDGEFTHAVRKSPRFSGSGESVSGALEISDDERTLAEQTLAKVRERLGPKSGLLYARVDVVRDPEGQLRVSEVELIEPSLYLVQYPPALERLVAAIEKYSGETMPADDAVVAPPKSRTTTRATKVRPVDVRKPFGRAPDPPTAADWEPKGGKARYRKPRGESAGKWRPTDEKLKVWSPEGDEAKPWKPTEDRGEAPKRESGKPGEWKARGEKSTGWKPRGEKPTGWKPRGEKPGEWKPRGGKPGEWKPRDARDNKPGEWKPRGEKSEGWKPRGDKPTGGWKPRGEKPGEWKPRGGKPGEWKPGENKPGEWKPRDRKPGEWKPREGTSGGWKPRGDKPAGGWKPRGEKPGEWKPRGGKPGEWKPREGKPGEWKPRDKKPGEWKPRDKKPGEWKPRENKPGEWKPRGDKPTGWKPREGKPGEWKPRDKKPGEWKPRGEKPGGEKPAGWKPRSGKPGEWKPRGPGPAGGKPAGRKFTGKRPPRRPAP